MKRLIAFVAAAFAVCSALHAQDVMCHAGVQGGGSLNNFSPTSEIKTEMLGGWHVGAVCIIKLPAYFVIQPSVNYEQDYSVLNITTVPVLNQRKVRQQIVNIPLSLQWGPDLGICRAFVQVVPALNINVGAKYDLDDGPEKRWIDIRKYMNVAQFGIGAGAGVDIWRFQIGIRYNWFFNTWKKDVADNPFTGLNGDHRNLSFTLTFFY